MKSVRYSTAIAALFMSTSTASAADFGITPTTDSVEVNNLRGGISFWGQYVASSNVEDSDGDDCPDADNFCKDVGGLGGYAALELPIGNTFSIIGDITFDWHNGMEDGDDDPIQENSALYGAAGLHLVAKTNAIDFGTFGVFGGGSTLDLEDDTPLFAGGGLEARFQNIFVQGGALVGLLEDDESVFDNLYFVRAGGDFSFGPVSFQLSGAYGWGDFDGDDGSGCCDEDSSQWAQIAAEYGHL